jgi:hypothetical protein
MIVTPVVEDSLALIQFRGANGHEHCKALEPELRCISVIHVAWTGQVRRHASLFNINDICIARRSIQEGVRNLSMTPASDACDTAPA